MSPLARCRPLSRAITQHSTPRRDVIAVIQDGGRGAATRGGRHADAAPTAVVDHRSLIARLIGVRRHDLRGAGGGWGPGLIRGGNPVDDQRDGQRE